MGGQKRNSGSSLHKQTSDLILKKKQSSDLVFSRRRSGKSKDPPSEQISVKQYMEKAVLALSLDPKEEGKKQRRRGVSFREEYRALKNGRTRIRAPSMIHEPTKDMIPPQRRDAKHKFTVVLDLDETLIYAREGPLYARPHLDLLFGLLSQHCETVVWTAGVKAYAQSIIRNIDPDSVIEHCIYRHKRWFSGQPGYQKDLTMLGRSMDRVIIVENTPDCIRGNPHNGILVSDYEGGEGIDPTIPILTHFLAALVDSGKTVPEFLQTTDMLTTIDMLTDLGDVYPVHALNCSMHAMQSNKRINRDLVQLVDLEKGAVPVFDNRGGSNNAGRGGSNNASRADAGRVVGECPTHIARSNPDNSGRRLRVEVDNLDNNGEDIASNEKKKEQDNVNLPPEGAVPLAVPISPGGSFHNDWINNVAV